ncbi:hypothetical protein BFL38_00595 [Brachyspira hampsonii]|uniref:Uncharacterized protein n=1 Tax=Brachyspira hampsonii TaxID=1287055 RepID=A0A1E5NAJ4_9SPIR|nr:hypothetical protein [Brachyspira hampsonii]OEJ13097.1 hypothetical protein BFL38_00595 [Brachyspira hampsonii]
MALSKPNEYKEVPAQQGETTVYAEDINQIISNIEKIKGGQANEAPISNIKELKERVDGLTNGSTSSASKIAFNNDNANLDFSDGYDFPPIKNQLSDNYNISLVTDYYLNSLSHIDNAEEVYDLVLEKSTDKYVLKGTLIYNNNNTSSNLIFNIISIQKKGEEKNKDIIYITNELSQFIYQYANASDNEIVIEGEEKLKYNFALVLGSPMFVIGKQDSSSFEAKEYTININIEISVNNIRNYQDFIFIQGTNDTVSFIKANNKNEKIVFQGNTKSKVGNTIFIIFNISMLENYLDIKTDKNDSYYIEANDMITSNKNKPIKYYIRKSVIDGTELSEKYSNINMTFGYLEIKHTDDTDIEKDEILSFNLTAQKNVDVEKIEKEKNIQNAIEILNSKIIDILNYLGLNFEEPQAGTIFTFEKTSLTLEVGDESTNINADIIKDITNLSLIANEDGSLNLKGSFEISNEGMGVIRVNKKLKLYKRKLVGVIYKEIQIICLYQDDYLYLIIMANKIQNTIFDLENIKIYDNNIICPIDFNYIKLTGHQVSEDFGIHLIDGKYILKGSITPNTVSISVYVNCYIEDFFENSKTYQYEGYTILIQNTKPLYGYISITGLTANKENTIYFECPKQPSI